MRTVLLRTKLFHSRGSLLPSIALLIALSTTALNVGALAQEKDKTKFLDDALQALERAKRRQLLEDSSEKVDERDRLLKSVREKAVAASRKRSELPKIDENSLKSRARVKALVKQASPEARRLIAKGRAATGLDDTTTIGDGQVSSAIDKATSRVNRASLKRTADATATPDTATTPAEARTIGGVPVPGEDLGPDVPINRKARSDNEKMRIVCQGQSFYDLSGNVILFEDQVVAKHPGFLIECEEMEVFLEAGAIAPAGGAQPKSATRQDSAGIRRAIAKGKGKQVDLVRYTPKGELVGKCGLVIFDGRTGDIELREWPVVSNGKFTRRAATKDAVIIIRQDGEHKTTGKFLDDFEEAENKN